MGNIFFQTIYLSMNKWILNYSICVGHLIVVQLLSKSVIVMRSEVMKAVTVRITAD